MEKTSNPNNPMKFKNFFHHCERTEQWEEKCWRIYPKLHATHCVTKIIEWRVKMRSDEEMPTSIAQRGIATQEDTETSKTNNKMMPRETIFQWLF